MLRSSESQALVLLILLILPDDVDVVVFALLAAVVLAYLPRICGDY